MIQILKLKHWQIFIIIILLRLISFILLELDKNVLTVFTLFIVNSIYLAYPIIIGIELSKYLPIEIKFNKNLFIFNGILFVIGVALIISFSFGKEYKFEGYYKIFGFYLIYACFSTWLTSVRIIKSIELNRKVKKRECILGFLAMALLPIGIWIFQPRINNIIKVN